MPTAVLSPTISTRRTASGGRCPGSKEQASQIRCARRTDQAKWHCAYGRHTEDGGQDCTGTTNREVHGAA